MHCLKGPEVERQVLDTVRAAVVKVHTRGHFGPSSTGQGPGPDRGPRATGPSHAGSTPDGPPGPLDVRPPPRAASRDYISRRALGRRRRTAGRPLFRESLTDPVAWQAGLCGERIDFREELPAEVGRAVPPPASAAPWPQPLPARTSPARLPACPVRMARFRSSAAPGIPDGGFRARSGLRGPPHHPLLALSLARPPHLPMAFFLAGRLRAQRLWILGPTLAELQLLHLRNGHSGSSGWVRLRTHCSNLNGQTPPTAKREFPLSSEEAFPVSGFMHVLSLCLECHFFKIQIQDMGQNQLLSPLGQNSLVKHWVFCGLWSCLSPHHLLSPLGEFAQLQWKSHRSANVCVLMLRYCLTCHRVLQGTSPSRGIGGQAYQCHWMPWVVSFSWRPLGPLWRGTRQLKPNTGRAQVLPWRILGNWRLALAPLAWPLSLGPQHACPSPLHASSGSFPCEPGHVAGPAGMREEE